MAKSILIVDDSDLVRRALRRLIEDSKQFVVCGEAANGKEAIDQAHPRLQTSGFAFS
jgi:YesN/AraC family two-component response regulator